MLPMNTSMLHKQFNNHKYLKTELDILNSSNKNDYYYPFAQINFSSNSSIYETNFVT